MLLNPSPGRTSLFPLAGAFALAVLAAQPLPAADAPGTGAAARGREIRANSSRPSAWRYAQVGGLEVLSTASDSSASGLVEDFAVKTRALDAFWPVDRTGLETAVLIIAGRQQDFAIANPRGGARSAGAMAGAGGRGSLRAVVNLDLSSAATVTRSGGPGRSANLSGSNGTVSAPLPQLPANAPGKAGVDSITTRLFPLILQRERGRSPAWLDEGAGKLLASMTATRTSVSFPALSSDRTLAVRTAGAEADLDKALAAGTFFPLERLFGGTNLSASETAVNECYQFIHLCLFGAEGKYRQAFLKFSDDLRAGQTVDAPSFKERFGTDYRGMLVELWKYTALAKKTTFRLEGPGGKALPPVTRVAFREATDEEIGRLVTPASAQAPGF